MPRLIIEELKSSGLFKIRHLFENYEYDYLKSNYKLNHEPLIDFLYDQIEREMSSNGTVKVFAACKNGDFCGLALIKEMPWESRIFGLRMAKIEHFLALGAYSEKFETKNRLLKSILEAARKRKIEHISSRINTLDFSGAHVLELNGFRIVDTILTYVVNAAKCKATKVKKIFVVKDGKPGDFKKLKTIVRGSFSNSRFYADSLFSKEKADNFYVEWLKKCCSGEWADGFLVAERNNKKVGFLSYQKDKELYKFTGVRMFGRGLSAVLPGNSGAFVSMLQEGLRSERGNYDTVELETHVFNYSVAKIFQKFGAHLGRSRYTFHLAIK